MTSPTPSATAPAGQVLLLPLTVKHSGHGVGCFSIYDANGSSLGIDFEEDTAGAIVTAVNTHSQLLAQNAALISALTAVTHAPENGEFDARLRLAALKRIAADALAKVSP